MTGGERGLSRRELFQKAGGGFASIALAGILADQRASCARGAEASDDPLAPKRPQIPPRAKRVIFLYMTGGVSHVDTFDPKPRLFADHGKSITVDNWQGKLGQFKRYLKTPQWTFRPGGECGTADQRSFPARARRRRRTVRHPLDGIEPHQSLRGDAGHPHRLVDLCPAERRGLGELRPGDGESEPALVRRFGTARPLRRRADLGLRFSAGLPSGPAGPARSRLPFPTSGVASPRSDCSGSNWT